MGDAANFQGLITNLVTLQQIIVIVFFLFLFLKFMLMLSFNFTV